MYAMEPNLYSASPNPRILLIRDLEYPDPDPANYGNETIMASWHVTLIVISWLVRLLIASWQVRLLLIASWQQVRLLAASYR